MKSLRNFIDETVFENGTTANYHPKNRDELKAIVDERIETHGDGCSLNDIDVSEITDMSFLFWMTDFKGDISKWDVSNVEDMEFMFSGARKFNGDISKWDVSKVKNMRGMFYGARSFARNLSKWDVSKVKDHKDMFVYCPLEKDTKKQPNF